MFKCHHCGIYFGNQDGLKNHIRINHVEKLQDAYPKESSKEVNNDTARKEPPPVPSLVHGLEELNDIVCTVQKEPVIFPYAECVKCKIILIGQETTDNHYKEVHNHIWKNIILSICQH